MMCKPGIRSQPPSGNTLLAVQTPRPEPKGFTQVELNSLPIAPFRRLSMNKRNLLGVVLIIVAVIAVFLFLAPATIDPDSDRMPDDVTGPGEEGMSATGTPSTPAVTPEASPSPGEVTVAP